MMTAMSTCQGVLRWSNSNLGSGPTTTHGTRGNDSFSRRNSNRFPVIVSRNSIIERACLGVVLERSAPVRFKAVPYAWRRVG